MPVTLAPSSRRNDRRSDRRNDRRDDRGAVAVLVAILLGGGVLLGVAALVVDVGQLYAEREELQTGADAAVLAVGKACASEATGCASNADIVALAQGYANANASDDAAQIVEVCGYLPGKLPDCVVSAGNLTDCLGAQPVQPEPFVEVRLATDMGDGNLALPPTFAQALAGNSGFDGASVGACARATWNREPDTRVLALSVSQCEFGNAVESVEYTIRITDGCGPGAVASAGWLDDEGGCQLTLPSGGVVSGDDPGTDPTAACIARLSSAWALVTQVWIPIHSGRSPSAGGFDYQHGSVAPFRITGYALGDTDRTPGFVGCDAPQDRCVSGEFTGPDLPLSALFGDAIVKLIG